ncbi:MAG: 5-oxoprolinase subunit PxpB, partial [Quisquiliibacterium sp.]
MQASSASDWRVEPVGDCCLMVVFGQQVDPAIHARVTALADHLFAHPIPGVTDVVPAFTTVSVHYRPDRVEGAGASPYDALRLRITTLLDRGLPSRQAAPRTVQIPVCYDEQFGPDLPEIAQACAMPIDEIIRRHVASEHMVYMLGFAPGFPYMGGLDAKLAMPRRSTPRVRIPAGTVAIAREQSAIYTLESPGGWNLIGRT